MTTTGLIIILAALVLGYEATKLFRPSTTKAANVSSVPAISPSTPSISAGSTSSSSNIPGSSNWGRQLSEAEVIDAINKALDMAGAPREWAQQIRWIISKEDAGLWTAIQNPQAVNGQHATGLGQLMPSTFETFVPGGDIADPVQNLFAAIWHIKSAYRTDSGYGTPYDPRLIASENAGIGY